MTQKWKAERVQEAEGLVFVAVHGMRREGKPVEGS